MRTILLGVGIGALGFLGGCSGGSQGTVSAEEDNLFKHPAKVDLSKIPPIHIQHNVPAFFGKASGATPKPPQAGAPPSAPN